VGALNAAVAIRFERVPLRRAVHRYTGSHRHSRWCFGYLGKGIFTFACRQRVIKIDGYDRSGYKVTLVTPMSIPGITNLEQAVPQGVDLEAIDFFKDRRFVGALLARQNGICFYSLRRLDERECALDHLVPQARGGDNSYRNIVCCTFEMNTRKGDVAAEDFLRSLYRSGFLSERDLEERLSTLASISSGVLQPAIHLPK
jgi:hypothetical protein